jgi:hypothetical protein
MADLAPNGVTLRTFVQDGLVLSEVDFQVGDLGEYPRCIGYMVGWNDGRSTLHQTEQIAIEAARKDHDADCDVLTVAIEAIAKPCNCKRRSPSIHLAAPGGE